jgi:hypothetical protein
MQLEPELSKRKSNPTWNRSSFDYTAEFHVELYLSIPLEKTGVDHRSNNSRLPPEVSVSFVVATSLYNNSSSFPLILSIRFEVDLSC